MSQTSYVSTPPEEPGWQMVTLETAPFAESTQIALAPFWKRDKIFEPTS